MDTISATFSENYLLSEEITFHAIFRTRTSDLSKATALSL